MLEIRELVKSYSPQDLALKGVGFSIEKSETVALIGPSGSGKSTLIRCINRLVEPTSGSVYLDGVNLTALRGKKLRHARRQIGMIFQEYALVERLTVMENVLSGRLGYFPFWTSLLRKYPSEDVIQGLELLKRVGLEDHFEKRADELSGGQRQRVGIARALLQSPSLLLVDEPTASLDPKTSRTILRLLCQLARENSLPVIINIHDVALAQQFADRIIGLREGKIVFDGKPSEVQGDILTRIYGEEDWHEHKKRKDHEAARQSVEEAAPESIASLEASCE
ncbi:MAG: phosphonate ABC transporter ATP-binding protein [Fibrobacterota bacterium]